MTVEKWTPERRMERTRACSHCIGADVFATRGFEGASLDEIAERPDIRVGRFTGTLRTKKTSSSPFPMPPTLKCSMFSRRNSTWKRTPP